MKPELDLKKLRSDITHRLGVKMFWRTISCDEELALIDRIEELESEISELRKESCGCLDH